MQTFHHYVAGTVIHYRATTAGIICFACIVVNKPHPFQCFSCRLPDLVHSIITESNASSIAEKTESFLRLFQQRGGRNGLQSLTIQSCQMQKREKTRGRTLKQWIRRHIYYNFSMKCDHSQSRQKAVSRTQSLFIIPRLKMWTQLLHGESKSVGGQK